MQWLRNALKTAIRSAVQEELTAQRGAETSHVTELLASMHKATDEMNHMLSRNAMRAARATAARAKEEETAADPHAGTLMDSSLSPKQVARRKWQLQQAQNQRSG